MYAFPKISGVENLFLWRGGVSWRAVIEMATAQRTRPRAVVGAPRRAAWQLKSALRHSISAAPRTKIFLHFFTIIVGDFLFMNSNG